MGRKEAFNGLLLEMMRRKDAGYAKGIKENFDAAWFLASKGTSGETSIDLVPDKDFNNPDVGREDLFNMNGTYGGAYQQALSWGNSQGVVAGSAMNEYFQVSKGVSSQHSNELLKSGPGVIGGALAAPALISASETVSATKAGKFLLGSKTSSAVIGGANGGVEGYMADGWKGAGIGTVAGAFMGYVAPAERVGLKGGWLSKAVGTSVDAAAAAGVTTAAINKMKNKSWSNSLLTNMGIAAGSSWLSLEAPAAHFVGKDISNAAKYYFGAQSEAYNLSLTALHNRMHN